MKWSADSSEVAVCHSFLRLHQPILTSTGLLTSSEKESIANPQMLLAMDLFSKDTPPRRKFSPDKDSGAGSGNSNQSVLTQKHLLTKNETLLKRFSPTGEILSLRSLSPSLGKPSCHWMSPKKETASLHSMSPRLDLSSSRNVSPRREMSSRVYFPPERGSLL
ncbi:hypothetical protein JRQ81_011744 [Phrynocephalus forsythii]|uniref:Uncharacterized protein n=1 Tax=Phrynocephalus forsythii TaxID=171643 RepID=A0A9Q0X9P2_9SAUR|nr:hypothetical protein JRQ81_011744 [Phrynocephalus forsythii]